ncbi:MAG: NADPH-dependent FMN reductase [Jatrophihabitans sp.]
MAVELLLITGSTRAGSTNGAALRTAQALVADGLLPDVRAEYYDGLSRLPHFNPDDDVEPLPPAVADLRARIGAAGALLFCTPEYAGALPGTLKNLLDWTIGGGEMSGKPVGWLNCSDRGAAGAYAELRTVLGYAGTVLVADGCAEVTVSRSDLSPAGLVEDPARRQQILAVLAALAQAAGT